MRPPGTLPWYTCTECEQSLPFGLYCARCDLGFPERAEHSPFALLGMRNRFQLPSELLNEAMAQARASLPPGTHNHPYEASGWARTELDRVDAILSRPWARAAWLLEQAGGKVPPRSSPSPPGKDSAALPEDSPEAMRRDLQQRPGLERRTRIRARLEELILALEADLTEDLELLADDTNETDPPGCELHNLIGERIAQLRTLHKLLIMSGPRRSAS